MDDKFLTVLSSILSVMYRNRRYQQGQNGRSGIDRGFQRDRDERPYLALLRANLVSRKGKTLIWILVSEHRFEAGLINEWTACRGGNLNVISRHPEYICFCHV